MTTNRHEAQIQRSLRLIKCLNDSCFQLEWIDLSLVIQLTDNKSICLTQVLFWLNNYLFP